MMDEQSENGNPATEAQAEGDASVAVGKRPRLAVPRLPAWKMPPLHMPRWTRPRWRKPVYRRPSLPDVVFSAGTACLVLALVYVLTAPSIGRLRTRAHEVAVLGNAATLQLAAETYAAGHLGHYPADVADLLRYLPDGEAPRNPYTGRSAAFQCGVGEVTYRSPTGGGDYLIEAWGPGTARPRLLVCLRGQASGPCE